MAGSEAGRGTGERGILLCLCKVKMTIGGFPCRLTSFSSLPRRPSRFDTGQVFSPRFFLPIVKKVSRVNRKLPG